MIRLRWRSSILPGTATTMLRPPSVVISASPTPLPSTRARMMSTDCCRVSAVTLPPPCTTGSRTICVPPSRSSPRRGAHCAPSAHVTWAPMMPARTTTRPTRASMVRPGRPWRLAAGSSHVRLSLLAGGCVGRRVRSSARAGLGGGVAPGAGTTLAMARRSQRTVWPGAVSSTATVSSIDTIRAYSPEVVSTSWPGCSVACRSVNWRCRLRWEVNRNSRSSTGRAKISRSEAFTRRCSFRRRWSRSTSGVGPASKVHAGADGRV